MTTNIMMLSQLAVVVFLWVAGTAFVCAHLAQYTKMSRMTSAQFGTILSLVPPLNILYIAFLMYKRSKRNDASPEEN